MRLLNSTTILLLGAITACSSRADLQCEQDSNCDLAGGGVCSDPGTGNRWCAYPDGSCPSGYRYSDVQVGDGVSGVCVAVGPDAGIDQPADMVLVPAGPFMMGCNVAIEGTTICGAIEQSDELPYHTVALNSFLIDKLELSRAKYKACVDAGVCESTGGEMTSNLPVAVDWTPASKYCKWAGKRLPTEAEWEKAARGNDGRTYPWGSTQPNCTLVNYEACGGSYVTVDSLSAGASPYGLLQMAGNITEWVSDIYQADYYAMSPNSNPTGPTVGDSKVARGGNGLSPPSQLRVANRAPELGGIGKYGFRCARDY